MRLEMNTHIRTSKPDDIEAYTDLLQLTYSQAYVLQDIGLDAACFSPEVFATEDTQKYLRSHLTETDMQKTWLAFSRDMLVGSVTCIIKNDHEAELMGFYVHPDYQGQGIGRKLYDLALTFSGNRDLMLDIFAHNTRSIKMYEKWGWKFDATRGDGGYFFRHWPEWPVGLQAKCMYMRLKRK
jgi:ribosomal protein S18 acetylase RimI-like enzyme